jgi:low affinity Fe/Cu permease
MDEIITHLEGPRDDIAGVETKTHEEIDAMRDEDDVLPS